MIETVNSTGGVVARYSYGQNIDEPLAESRSGTTSYYEQDALGSVTSLTNAAGTLAQTYTYDSFGNTTNSTGSLTNFFRYTGREFDTETDLYYNRARYLDPSTGKFLSEDPLRFAANGVNFYEYAYNDPTKFTDPSGMQQTVPVTPTAPVMPPPAPPVEPIPPVIPVAGGGAAAGGGSALAVGGLVAVDVGLAAYDGYQFYKLGVAYGWWGQPAPQQCNSGRLSKCVPLGYDKQLLGCRYICDDGTVWFQSGSCVNPLYKPWGQGFPKYPPIKKP
ncbi:MAG TPA: RHS repeat-associated core domain-containing protein [Candidatus Acidoferrales bacterium]|nr:RHS repeat-associated core domain-containing protein [Candidatus Acidoferrales bacterium]